MPAARFTPEQIAARAQFSADDLAEIHKRRRDNNRLGFAYHLTFVRLANRFPAQQPLEVVEDLLSFVSIQLNIDAAVIATYEQRQQTMAEHRAALLDYLQLRHFEAEETSQLEAHLFSEACRLEQTGPLLVKAKHFLQENGIFPADGALRRLIGAQRRLASRQGGQQTRCAQLWRQSWLMAATLAPTPCRDWPATSATIKIEQITDWHLTEEAQRQALADVVNAISRLHVTQAWGEGKTSSSDGQRFRMKRKLLQRTYSHRFQDYAMEFYTFVAGNYAPFYSIPIECTDRDAAYVLDGLL